MPRAIDLFLDSDQPLDRLADLLSDLTGRDFVPAPDHRRFVMQEGEVVAHLSGHDFVDDDGLPLSEFRYVLSTSAPYGSDLEETAEVACLRRISVQLRDQAELPCLLVIDLERPDWPDGPGTLPHPGRGASPLPARPSSGVWSGDRHSREGVEGGDE